MSFISQVPDRDSIRRAYDVWSHVYDLVAAPWEHGARTQALATVADRLGGRVLDVGTGSGAYLAQIVQAAGPAAIVCGVDFSRKMAMKARRRLRRSSLDRGHVIEADALALPYGDDSFDSVLSSYLLDLLPIEAMAGALGEFLRILKPNGLVVLVNLTKTTLDGTSWYERYYRALPSIGKAYVLGGCRPVRLAHLVSAAGFVDARRTLVPQVLPSEIVIARKPA